MSIFDTDGKIQLFPIDESQPDAYSIVRVLNELAVEFGRNPEIRQFTELALPYDLRNNDIAGQIRACLAFVKTHVVFVADPEGTEYVKSPLGMFRELYSTGRVLGDCDDHCLLLASMLRSLGMQAWIAGVKQSPASTYIDHVIVELALPGGVADLDPCAKQGLQPVYHERIRFRP